MASTEQVRIDLVANDQASKKIEAVADDVERLEDADPTVTIDADDNATAVVGSLAADVEALAKADPTVTIGADDNASGPIADVAADVSELTAADREIVLKAQIGQAQSELKSLRDDLEQTGDKADDTARHLDKVGGQGPSLRGNAIADLTGPLGEASSAASDFAGVFDGLGDIAEGVASKVGLSGEAIAGAMGGIGVGVAVAAAAWSFYKQKQEEARRKQEELIKSTRTLNDALEAGDIRKAGDAFVAAYGDALDAAEALGVGVRDATRFITGQTDALPELNAEIDALTKKIEDNGGELAAWNNTTIAQRTQLEKLRDQVTGARDDYDDANGSIREQDARLREVQGGLRGATTDTKDLGRAQRDTRGDVDDLTSAFDRLKGELDFEQTMLDFARVFADAANDNEQTIAEQTQDVLNYKQFIVDTGEQLKKSPLEIQTVLDQVEAGDLYATKATLEQWFKMNPIIIASKLDRPGQITGGLTGTGGGPSRTAAPEIGVVNMTLPAGWRGDPIRTARAQRRRSGRLFAR